MNGSVLDAEKALKNGADPNFLVKGQFPIVIVTVGLNRFDIATLLVNKGADVNSGEPPLVFLTLRQYCYSKSNAGLKFLELILKKGADANVISNNGEGLTPLCWAKKSRCYEAEKYYKYKAKLGDCPKM